MSLEKRPTILKKACDATYYGIIQLLKAALTTEGRITPITEKRVEKWVERDRATHKAQRLIFGKRRGV